jgi:nucleotide-binding universal stress UspA family protein
MNVECTNLFHFTMSLYPIRNILVPVDFGENSLNALETAVVIARRHGATLHLLHVVDTGFDFLNTGDSYLSINSITENSGDILHALAGSVAQKHKIIPQVVLAEGCVYQAIIRESLRCTADLIVMGTHGASGQRDAFVGTNSYNVFKHAHSAVLAVPSGRIWTQFRRVLFPVRLVVGALARYDFVRSLLSPGTTALEVLGLSYHRADNDKHLMEELVSEISDKLAEDRIKAYVSCLSGRNMVDNILGYSEQKGTDLIVITPSVDVASKHFYVGPNAQRIIHQAGVPVLSVKRVAVPAFG